jgi:hypothetical protein
LKAYVLSNNPTLGLAYCYQGATTFSTTALSIMTLSIMTLSIITLSIIAKL